MNTLRQAVLLGVLGTFALCAVGPLLQWAAGQALQLVGAGVADGLRSVGVGCGVALVVLAAFGGAIGWLIAATTRHDRQYIRYVEAPPVAPALPPTQAIEPSYYVVKESEYVDN